MPKRTTNFRSDLLGDLKNPQEALQYLNATLSLLNCPLDNDMFLAALRDIVEANLGGMLPVKEGFLTGSTGRERMQAQISKLRTELAKAQEDSKDLDWYENQLRIDPDDKVVWNHGEQRIKAAAADSMLRSYPTLREAIRAERVK